MFPDWCSQKTNDLIRAWEWFGFWMQGETDGRYELQRRYIAAVLIARGIVWIRRYHPELKVAVD